MICQNCGFDHDGSMGNCPKCGAPVYNQMNNGFNQSPNGFNQSPNGFNQMPYMGNGFRAPIAHKDIVVCIILSFVTCGIYGIVWFINLVDDLNTATNDVNGQSGVMVFLLTLVTCGIYGIYWFYKAGEKVNYIKQMQGFAPDSSVCIIYLLLSIFGLNIVNYALIQNELNRVAMQ